jgi:hypothetical protein
MVNRPDRHSPASTALALAASQIPLDRRGVVLTRDEAAARVRSDFLTLPGLRLTAAQAARLWLLTDDVAAGILEDLTRIGFLVCRHEVYERR